MEHDVGTANDDCIFPSNITISYSPEHFHNRCFGVRGTMTGFSLPKMSHIERMEAVDILIRINGQQLPHHVDMGTVEATGLNACGVDPDCSGQ